MKKNINHIPSIKFQVNTNTYKWEKVTEGSGTQTTSHISKMVDVTVGLRGSSTALNRELRKIIEEKHSMLETNNTYPRMMIKHQK